MRKRVQRMSGGGVVQVEGTASAKALRQESHGAPKGKQGDQCGRDCVWEHSRAGTSGAVSVLHGTCFIRQSCMHLDHPWASHETAASLKMQGIALDQSGTVVVV